MAKFDSLGKALVFATIAALITTAILYFILDLSGIWFWLAMFLSPWIIIGIIAALVFVNVLVFGYYMGEKKTTYVDRSQQTAQTGGFSAPLQVKDGSQDE